MSSPIISCPSSMKPHVDKVLNGEYGIAGLKLEKPVVLDLGANVGAFALWVKKQWPDAEVMCYEPHPETYQLLLKNTQHLTGVSLHQKAVSNRIGSGFLRDGLNNCGEASLYDLGEQSKVGQEVSVIDASDLPACDFLKIDTEGSEVQILMNYRHLDSVSVVALEWHSPEDRRTLEAWLREHGFTCYEDRQWAHERGIMKWTKGVEIGNAPGVPANSVNLLIASPCYGGQTYATHNSSLFGLMIDLLRSGVRYEQRYLPNESLIPRARNRFGTMMLQGDFTHLLFLDVDIGFTPRDIISLIALDKDIAALPYSAKDYDFTKIIKAVKRGITDPEILRHCAGRPIINATEKTTFEVNEAVQFPQLGTGILLIKRKVFEKMAEDPTRKYKLMMNERGELKDDYAYDFFRCGVNQETNYYDSEDYRFCIDAQKLGFETWLWPNAITTHTGPCTFIMDIPTQAALGINLNDPQQIEQPDESPVHS